MFDVYEYMRQINVSDKSFCHLNCKFFHPHNRVVSGQTDGRTTSVRSAYRGNSLKNLALLDMKICLRSEEN